MRPSLSSFEWVKSRFISTSAKEVLKLYILQLLLFTKNKYRIFNILKSCIQWIAQKSCSVMIMVLTYKYVTHSFQLRLRTLCNLGRVICNKLLCVLSRKCYSERFFRYLAFFCKLSTYMVSKIKVLEINLLLVKVKVCFSKYLPRLKFLFATGWPKLEFT